MGSKKYGKRNQDDILLLRLRILERLRQDKYASQIAEELKISKQLCSYHVGQLEEKGYIEEKFRGTFILYRLTRKGLFFIQQVKNNSPGVRKKTRVHNLAIKYPVLDDNPDATWEKEIPINNWIKKVEKVHFPIKITLVKTPKSIIAYYWRFYTPQDYTFLSEFYNYVLKGAWYVQAFLQREKGITIDLFAGETISTHLANETPELNRKIREGVVVSKDLGRPARNVFPSKKPAKAWLERSLGDVEVETNDLLYEEKLLSMPENVHTIANDLGPAVMDFAYQLDNHQTTLRRIGTAVEDLTKTVKDLKGVISTLKDD